MQIQDSPIDLSRGHRFDGHMLAGMLYSVVTFGCQMNKHDSERAAGILEALGALPGADPESSDIVIYMTCCVREAADNREYGQISSLDSSSAPHGRRIICVGGCIGQRDGLGLVKRIPTIDIVFGTHNISALPDLIARVLDGERHIVETPEEDDCFASELPSRREQHWHAWVPIMTGCNNFCSYCIVPHVRGRERSRTLEDIGNELETLRGSGVEEITLLGQNVNSYGRDLFGRPRFSEVLRMADSIGFPRIRFATSHPKDMSDETIAAMAECDSVMPSLHLAVQSGSARILKAMNRHYTPGDYLTLVDKVRSAVPGIALSTDIIVGFPGETEEDFLDTLRLAQQVGFAQAFTFIFSPREGTPAARIEDDTPREVIQDRFDRLVTAIQDSAFNFNQGFKGGEVEVLVEGTSKRDDSMLSGRGPHNQIVHAPLLESQNIEDLVGTFVNVRVDTARTWYLSGVQS